MRIRDIRPDKENHMAIFRVNEKEKKLSVNKSDAFSEIGENQLPPADKKITDFLAEMDEAIQVSQKSSTEYSEYPRITKQALANSHGDWYEWILAITAINVYLTQNSDFIALLLPNVSRFNISNLYTEDIQEIIDDLVKKVKDATDVQFVTSNPDLVIIDTRKLNISTGFDQSIDFIDGETIRKVENLYKSFIGKCSYSEIIGYISVKTSLRPDRRLQIPHEGSLMKAIYTHLQTRQWILKPRGLKYYAASTEIREPDRNALKTVATHSIITVNSLPQAAVDEVFEINTVNRAKDVFKTILNNSIEP